MRKFITVFALIGFVATLGLGSALADDFVTACVKEKKNGDPKKNKSFKRVAIGTEPGSPCKSKEVEVTLVTDELAASLQAQITTNANNISTNTTNIANNTAAIGANTAAIEDNADMIANIKAGLISSQIGGGHNSSADGADTFYMPLYNWFRGGVQEEMASKMSVTGWLTKLSVITNEPVGNDAAEIFKYVVDGIPIDLDGLIETVCQVTGDTSTMCESTGCFKIDMGQTLSVQVLAVDAGASPNVSPTRWTGRFVETDEECPVLAP